MDERITITGICRYPRLTCRKCVQSASSILHRIYLGHARVNSSNARATRSFFPSGFPTWAHISRPTHVQASRGFGGGVARHVLGSDASTSTVCEGPALGSRPHADTHLDLEHGVLDFGVFEEFCRCRFLPSLVAFRLQLFTRYSAVMEVENRCYMAIQIVGPLVCLPLDNAVRNYTEHEVMFSCDRS